MPMYLSSYPYPEMLDKVKALGADAVEHYAQSMYDCAKLTGKIGVKKLVSMAGLPAGNETDTTPNWIVSTISGRTLWYRHMNISGR